MPKLEKRNSKLGLLLAALLLAVMPVGAQQAAELVQVEDQPTLLFRAGHQHKTLPKFTWCFGNLYVSRNAIRYEVTDAEGGGNAARYREHGFSVSRTQFAGAKRWYSGVEIRLVQGKPYHLHIYQAGSRAVGRDGFIQPEPLLEALDNFEVALARVQPAAPPTAVAPLAPPPAPEPPKTATLQIEAQPGNAEFYVDDQFKGTTSAEGRLVVADLAPGEHRLRLARKGYQEWSRTVTLTAGENRTIEAQLAEAVPETALKLEDVLKLLEAGVTPARLETIVKERGVSFELTDDAERKLRALGATDSLLLAIAKAKK